MTKPASNRPRQRHWLTAVAVSLALVAPCVASRSPSDVVDAMSGQVLKVLRDQSLDVDKRRAEVEQIIYSNVDFDTLSRLVMARNWRRLSDEQKVEFKRLFKSHLSDTYGDNVDNYRNEKVQILSQRDEKRGDVTVKTKIVRGGTDDVLVDYRLRKKNDEWLIIDVVIEGVSLVANFRSQFQDIMSNGGADRLLKLLREKDIEPPPGA